MCEVLPFITVFAQISGKYTICVVLHVSGAESDHLRSYLYFLDTGSEECCQRGSIKLNDDGLWTADISYSERRRLYKHLDCHL